MTTETTIEPASRPSPHRARWAAIGAAVAVTIGAGGLGIARAIVTDNPQNVYVAIEPCRLLDTRPATNVGPRNTPAGNGETFTLVGVGDVAGACNLPTGIKALQLNVTAVNATAPTFLTIFPAGGAQPLASSLNPAPGQPPTPNAVTVTLSNDGQFSIFNNAGTVDIIIDIAGYYDDHRHNSADITNDAGVAFNYDDTVLALTGAAQVVVSTAIRVPSDGFLNIQATGSWQGPVGPGTDQARCQLAVGASTIDSSLPHTFLNDGGSAGVGFFGFSMHRTVSVNVADNPLLILGGQSVRLLCLESAGEVEIEDVQITATFFATEYEPNLVFTPLSDGLAEED